MTSTFSVVSTMASGSTVLPTTAATGFYVGVIAQEVRAIAPDAVVRGRDGYFRVHYDKLGLRFQTYDQWTASGAQTPRPRGLTFPSPRDAVRANR